MQLSKEELNALIELAKQQLDTKEDPKVSDVYMFITDLGIQPGETALLPTEVYLIYQDWGGNKSQAKFGREFKRYFMDSARVRRGQKMYLLDPKSFDMTEDSIAERKERLEKRYGHLKNKKTQ